MKLKTQEMVTAGLAFAFYIFGGLGTIFGLLLVFYQSGKDLLGWGDGRTIGYLFLCVGFALTLFGLVLMRLIRVSMQSPVTVNKGDL